MKVELPDGNWVEFRPLTNGLRKEILTVSAKEVSPDVAPGVALTDRDSELIVLVTSSWSLAPLPISVESLDALEPIEIYDALSDALKALVGRLFPRAGDVTDPKAESDKSTSSAPSEADSSPEKVAT